jgi:ATP adenylyltransferase
MERLWTPWRRAFVEGAATDTASACFLCTAPAANQDAETFLLYRAQRTFVILNLYPYNTGHMLVAPYDHIGDLAKLDGPIAAEMMHTVQRCVDALQRVYRPDGCNVGMNLGKAAGAGVPDHLHIHIVPRWNGDTNFMPVLATTKVLPESLDQTYARLRPVFDEPSPPTLRCATRGI